MEYNNEQYHEEEEVQCGFCNITGPAIFIVEHINSLHNKNNDNVVEWVDADGGPECSTATEEESSKYDYKPVQYTINNQHIKSYRGRVE